MRALHLLPLRPPALLVAILAPKRLLHGDRHTSERGEYRGRAGYPYNPRGRGRGRGRGTRRDGDSMDRRSWSVDSPSAGPEQGEHRFRNGDYSNRQTGGLSQGETVAEEKKVGEAKVVSPTSVRSDASRNTRRRDDENIGHDSRQKEQDKSIDDEIGWRYEKVDKNFQTKLEAAYEENREKIHRLFSEPLVINLPKHDGNFCPDLFVGFSHYEHRMRDEYRQVIAKILGLADPKMIALSSAWSGRFNPSAFPASRKVLGVSIKGIKRTDDNEKDVNRGAQRETSEDKDGRHDGEYSAKIRAAVADINKNRYLKHHINAASIATAEVELKADDKNVFLVAKHISHEAQAHRVFVLCFSDKDVEKFSAMMDSWLRAAEVVPKILLAKDLLVACSLPGDLRILHEGSGGGGGDFEQQQRREGRIEVPSPSFQILMSSLKQIAGGYDVNPSCVVFINGALLGGLPVMAEFVRRNSRGLLAALQRPNDVEFKNLAMRRVGKKASRPVLMRDSDKPTSR